MISNRSRVRTVADRQALYLTSALVSCLCLPFHPALAQQAGAQPIEEIVVTGSLIRGIAPAGASVIGVDAQAITESGATGGVDILATIPQVQNFFNQMPDVGGNNPFGVNAAPVARPNLRSLPAVNVNAGSLTLVMMDGHRVTPGGLAQVAVDPDIVPPSLLQRVEIMPDGASALYGSDAVGGVINFIPRKSYDGFEVSARAGFAKNGYSTHDYSVTAGKAWDRGSIFGSYSHAYHDPIRGVDRDYIKQIEYTATSPFFGRGLERACSPGNVSVQVGADNLTNTFALNSSGNVVAGPENRCETTDFQTFYSREYRDSFYGGGSYELTDALKFDVTGFYSRRMQFTNGGPNRINTTGANLVTAANPHYASRNAAIAAINPALAGLPHVVRNTFENVVGIPKRNNITKTWQVTPTLSWDIGGGWQLRALATYGKNRTEARAASIIGATVNARIASGLINPYNPAASGAGAFDNLFGTTRSLGNVEFQNYRVVGDGPVFTLPGGEVRVAAGAEYMVTDYNRQSTNAAFVLQAPVPYKQSVKSVFGEVRVPIVGPSNRMAGIEALTVSAALRRDDYNDFGDTTNPSIGVTYDPIDWVSLRGMWGKSFVAPSAAAQTNVGTSGLIALCNNGCFGPLFVPVGAPAPGPNEIGLILNMGSSPNLKPQTSENWSMGIDLRPPALEGLTVSATYYTVKMRNILQTPQCCGVPEQLRSFPNSFVYKGGVPFTQAEIDAYIRPGSPTSVQAYRDNFTGRPVIIMIDNQVTNIGGAKVKGIDFNVRYVRDVSFGSVDLTLQGNHELVNQVQDPPGPITNRLSPGGDVPRWRWSTGLGATVKGGFRARVTWNHTAGYAVDPTLNFGQTRVAAFDTVDTFLSYEFGGDNFVTRDLRISLNINNLLDKDPPVLTRTGFQNFGYANTAFTVGRLFQFGINKKF